MKEKDREKFAKQFTGLDRIIADRLIEKTGKIQTSGSGLVFDSALSAVPMAGVIMAGGIDNLRIELEKSFSIKEVKEIVKESREEDYRQLEQIKN